MTIYSVAAYFYDYQNNYKGMISTPIRSTQYNYSQKTICRKALKYVKAQAKKLKKFTTVSTADIAYTIYEWYEETGIIPIKRQPINQVTV